MMYLFTQVLFDANGNKVASGTTDYQTIDSAEQAFHTAMASAISKDTYSKAIMFVFDSNGEIKFRRVWERA